jgi:hypothetical protein
MDSKHNWGSAADIVSGSWTGSADINSIDWNKQTTGITPNWYSGGIVPDPNIGSTFNLPHRYVGIQCLYCNTQFSTAVFATLTDRCFAVYCASCQKWFMAHMEVCHSECDKRVECLMKGIIIHVGKREIVDIIGVRVPDQNEWAINSHCKSNVVYGEFSNLYNIMYGNQYSEATIQNDWLKGNSFQLPDVSKR